MKTQKRQIIIILFGINCPECIRKIKEIKAVKL